MINRRSSQLRAFIALVLFSTSGGGAQLLDALVFHSHPAPASGPRVNAGDHCHAETCELGVPITSPPQVAPPDIHGRFEPPTRRATAVTPTDAPRTTLAAAPLGSRAPPARS
jgi:hypothetical protein